MGYWNTKMNKWEKKLTSDVQECSVENVVVFFGVVLEHHTWNWPVLMIADPLTGEVLDDGRRDTDENIASFIWHPNNSRISNDFGDSFKQFKWENEKKNNNKKTITKKKIKLEVKRAKTKPWMNSCLALGCHDATDVKFNKYDYEIKVFLIYHFSITLPVCAVL